MVEKGKRARGQHVTAAAVIAGGLLMRNACMEGWAGHSWGVRQNIAFMLCCGSAPRWYAHGHAPPVGIVALVKLSSCMHPLMCQCRRDNSLALPAHVTNFFL
jgi:hypothetical protein